MSCCTTNDAVAVEIDDKNLAASGVLADDDDTHINARSHTTYTPGDEGEFFWSGEGAVTKVGTVWGSGPYTAHSNIVLAALHAGAVQRGKPDVKQYFHVERIVASCVLMYHESEHYGVISKRCGYHPLGAVMITGATRFPRMRRLREFVVNRIEPFFPDIGVDLLFECVVIPLPPTTALDAPNEGAEEVPSSQLMLPTNADAGSQSSSYVSSKVSKKTKSRTKEEKNLVQHHNSLCYVDTVRMKAMRDKVSGHPDENTPELQSWYQMTERITVLLKQHEEDDEEIDKTCDDDDDLSLSKKGRRVFLLYQMTERITVLLKQDEENEDIDKNKTDDDDDDSSLSKKGKRVFLFRLAWSNDVTKHNMSADAIDVDSDVRITSAKGCMDGFRLVITFAIGAALGFVPIFDVLSDVVTTVEFITTANYLWFYVSLAILVNSMRFVTAFHVMDPEPNWGNLVITLIPFAHIAKLPFITEVEVKEKDKTLTLAKKFSSSTVDKVLLVDRTAAKISANNNNFVTMVRAAPTRNLAGLFHEDSLPLNFYDDIDDDAGADGEDVVPTLSPQQQDPHHPHNSSSEDDDVDPLGGFQRRPSPPAAVLSGGALSNYMTNITHDASLRIHILSPEENHQRHPVEQNT
ncbi:transmembrane protein, putative, partial [Bodo saltans]